MSRTDHNTLPMPSICRLFAFPLIEAPLGSFLMLPGTKSCLSKVTLWLAPESHITLKLSIGSMAALHATGCCRTTASDSRQLHSCHPFGVGTVGAMLGESLGEPIGLSVGDGPLGGWNEG